MENIILTHESFIKTPIFKILEEAINAFDCSSCGMEAKVISEYYLENSFLKLTGASEQKMKCIVWELATNDYDYRYKMLQKTYGECSAFDEKKKIFQDLIGQLKKYEVDFQNIFGDKEKNQLLENTKLSIEGIFNKSIIKDLYPRTYFDFFIDENSLWNTINGRSFCIYNGKIGKDANLQFLDDTLIDYYKYSIFDHRNRCAHNLKSYQNNLPSLKTLAGDYSMYENYFLRFWLLVLIDEIFIKLFCSCIELFGKDI